MFPPAFGPQRHDSASHNSFHFIVYLGHFYAYKKNQNSSKCSMPLRKKQQLNKLQSGTICWPSWDTVGNRCDDLTVFPMCRLALRAKALELRCPDAPRLSLSVGPQNSLRPGLCVNWLGHTGKTAKLFGGKDTYKSLSAGWLRWHCSRLFLQVIPPVYPVSGHGQDKQTFSRRMLTKCLLFFTQAL